MLYFSFETAFYKQYQKVLDVVFTKADQDWLLKILNRELSLENDEDTVTHDSFSSKTVYRAPHGSK